MGFVEDKKKVLEEAGILKIIRDIQNTETTFSFNSSTETSKNILPYLLDLLSVLTDSSDEEKKDKVKLDKKRADLDDDGKLSKYEKKRGEAIQNAINKKDKSKLKKEEKSCSSKKEVEEAKKKAKKDAKKHMKHYEGKDMKEKQNENEKENLEEAFIYSPLFESKERLMPDAFNKREDKIYNDLLEKFGIKKNA